MSGNQ